MSERELIPGSIVKSDCNVRDEVDKDGEKYNELKQSIESVGIKVRPIVRLENGEHAAVDGYHRALIADELGFDTITVDYREDLDDAEARMISLGANEDFFRKKIDPYERAAHLELMWNDMGGEGLPSSSELSDMISVPQGTVDRWLEPTRNHWEDTVFDPTSETLHELTVSKRKEIGMRKLRSIRKTTDGGEQGEALAEKVLDEGLTIQDLAEVRQYVNKGADIDGAVRCVTGEASMADLAVEPETEETDTTDTPTTSTSTSSTTDTTETTDTTSPEPEPDNEEVEEEELARGQEDEDDGSTWIDDLEEPDEDDSAESLHETDNEYMGSNLTVTVEDDQGIVVGEIVLPEQVSAAYRECVDTTSFPADEVLEHSLAKWLRPTWLPEGWARNRKETTSPDNTD